jgi:hypothetical protein
VQAQVGAAASKASSSARGAEGMDEDD